MVRHFPFLDLRFYVADIRLFPQDYVFSKAEEKGLLAGLKKARQTDASHKDDHYGAGKKKISVRGSVEEKYSYKCKGEARCRTTCADAKCAHARLECGRDGQCNGMVFLTSTGAEWPDVGGDLTGAIVVFQSFTIGSKPFVLQYLPFL